MLTKMTVRNFKRFEVAEIELGSPVVFIGPNNSGKTTALQALALWYTGLKTWLEKRKDKITPEKRPGVTINRRELITIPVSEAKHLWHNLHVRNVKRIEGKQKTENIRIDILIEGVTNSQTWTCGFEFDFANAESFFCRPLRTTEGKNPERLYVPEIVENIRLAYLPPMSGLIANETRLDPGAINVRLGEGRTAEVLRNLCYQIFTQENGKQKWQTICDRIHILFGVNLDAPEYIPERGEISMTYRESGVRLDLASSGRGLQQTLLLLAHLTVNPMSVLLLDEPDAHLEILRQRQIYQILTETAREQNSQIIAASHSEVVLNEAAGKDVVVAFLGKPHRIDDQQGSQLLKSLREIGFDQYYQAEQTGWILYLEGATDLAILKTFAEKLNHPSKGCLERPFVYYAQQPTKGREHFYGLREAKNDLVGFLLFDRSRFQLRQNENLYEYMWKKNEIENYICQPETLKRYAEASAEVVNLGPLFSNSESQKRRHIMETCIEDFVPPIALRNPEDPFWQNIKASDEFLNRIFETFFQKLELPNRMSKTDYHILAQFVPKDIIDTEVHQVLDRIFEVSQKAKPVIEIDHDPEENK